MKEEKQWKVENSNKRKDLNLNPIQHGKALKKITLTPHPKWYKEATMQSLTHPDYITLEYLVIDNNFGKLFNNDSFN